MTLTSSLTAETQVVASASPVMSELAGEAVILDPVSGIYYGLNNDVGIRVWQLIQQQVTVHRVRETILSEYAVDVSQCDRDITQILQSLVDNNLAKVCNAT